MSKTARDFTLIYNADGTCTFWDCGRVGVVLAYDDFSPEVAHWFCAAHWPAYEDIMLVVEDRRKMRREP